MSDSVGFPSPNPAASPEQDTDEVIAVEQLPQEMGKVTITVAIQAAEDEEPEEVSANNVDFLGGSCSEDELGRHDKSRWDPPHSLLGVVLAPKLDPLVLLGEESGWRNPSGQLLGQRGSVARLPHGVGSAR